MNRFAILMLIVLSGFGLEAQTADPQFLAADQSLMVMPTAYTMPKGMSSVTDFEVLLLQYSNALTDRLHLSAGMMFPVSKEAIKTFTLGTKFNYYRWHQFQTALWASYTPDPQTSTVGNIVSYGNTSASLHLLTAAMLDFNNGEQHFVYGLGGIKTLSKRVSGIGEFFYFPWTFDFDEDDPDIQDDQELDKVALIGIRFKGQKMSWDLGAIRPVGIDMGDLIAFPFVKATFMF